MQTKKTRLMISFLTIIVGALLIGGTTVAYFSSSAQNTGNSFASGTLQVELDKEDGDFYFDLANISPSDSGAVSVVISNSGSLDLQYEVVLALTGDLSIGENPLALTLLDEGEESIDLTKKRTIKVDESETLLITWEMPLEAGNEYQGATGTLNILVNAEQRTEGGSQLVDNSNRIVQDLNQNALLGGVSLVYAKSGGPQNAWSVKIEQYLEGSAPGTNIYGFVNPVPAPNPQYQGQAIINYDSMGLPEQFWNPAVFITGNAAYSYDITPDHPHYQRLYGSMIFYKSDNASNTINYYSIDENGQKSQMGSVLAEGLN